MTTATLDIPTTAIAPTTTKIKGKPGRPRKTPTKNPAKKIYQLKAEVAAILGTGKAAEVKKQLKLLGMSGLTKLDLRCTWSWALILSNVQGLPVADANKIKIDDNK